MLAGRTSHQMSLAQGVSKFIRGVIYSPYRHPTPATRMTKLRHIICLSALLLAGCTSTGVHPIGGNQYFISEQSSQMLFGDPILSERSALNAAQDFCNSQEQSQVNVIKLDIKPSVLQTPGHVNLTFSCMPQASSQY
jgi:hypothetical protein